MRLFLTKDGTAGFALHGDDIVSVFKHPDSPHKGVARAALELAVKNGGRRLDCFDTVLPGFYSNNHFRAVARLKWNDDYAPDHWDYQGMKWFNNGRPDVVFMVYDPDHQQLYEPGDGQLVDDYAAATELQRRELHRINALAPVGDAMHLQDETAEERQAEALERIADLEELQFYGAGAKRTTDVYITKDRITIRRRCRCPTKGRRIAYNKFAY